MDDKISHKENTRRFDLISIGELSKLTNVNIKSLRYYEKIGILLPVYVNPDSSYRYYTYSQVQLVLSIQFYVNLGIPLHTLHQFIDRSTGQIDFADQISYGISTARQRVADLQKQIDHAESLLSEITRCENLSRNNCPVPCKMPPKNCIAIPVTGTITEQKYYALLHQLFVEAHRKNISIQGETGVIQLSDNDITQTCVFADIHVTPSSELSFSGQIKYLYLPESVYQCVCSPFFDLSDKKILQQKLPENFGNGIIILTELFNKQFDYKNMLFELRFRDLTF